jgi:NAD(P)-dependent dehydrogenase (short-subunit alcohol dehydrogenase family)
MSTLHGIAVITGAQGGIGQSLVRAFATAGYAVLGVDVREPLATAVEGAHYLTVDISSGAGADEVAAACSGADRLVVCNNAARRDGFALAGEVSDQLWREVIAVNLTGPFLLTNRVIPLMLRHGGEVRARWTHPERGRQLRLERDPLQRDLSRSDSASGRRDRSVSKRERGPDAQGIGVRTGARRPGRRRGRGGVPGLAGRSTNQRRGPAGR